jgi:hypothetical protein
MAATNNGFLAILHNRGAEGEGALFAELEHIP